MRGRSSGRPTTGQRRRVPAPGPPRPSPRSRPTRPVPHTGAPGPARRPGPPRPSRCPPTPRRRPGPPPTPDPGQTPGRPPQPALPHAALSAATGTPRARSRTNRSATPDHSWPRRAPAARPASPTRSASLSSPGHTGRATPLTAARPPGRHRPQPRRPRRRRGASARPGTGPQRWSNPVTWTTRATLYPCASRSRACAAVHPPASSTLNRRTIGCTRGRSATPATV